MSELKPWEGPEGDAPSDEAGDGSRGYLLGAGILAGLVFAIGSRALLGHFAERPELAAADPLLARLLVWSQGGGWVLAVGCALGLAFSLRASRKSP